MSRDNRFPADKAGLTVRSPSQRSRAQSTMTGRYARRGYDAPPGLLVSDGGINAAPPL